MSDDVTLVAAIFDTQCDCGGRVELLYKDAREHFSLITGKHGGIDSCDALDTAGARSWIARHRDRATVVVDV